MSNKIDERIVEMSFDNRKFEQGTAQTRKSLNEFKKTLDFTDAESSINKFSAVFAAKFTLVQNIANRVIDSVVNLVKSVAVAPISDGWDEYAVKLNTVQTIMNATGKAAEEVEEKIRILDDYADKTVYSTRDMFDNLSIFTNSGVELDKATQAMIGIANATALAGQGTQAATYAYRNFSDAIANGHMSLMDFRSISRVAKIATQEFRQVVLDTAVETGTLTKSEEGLYQTTASGIPVTRQFEDTLQEQWLTAETVTAALEKYADTQSDLGKRAWAAAQDVKTFGAMMETLKATVGTGWSQTFENIFGDLEQAKALWTGLTNAIGGFIGHISDARNGVLEFWNAHGGRAAFLDALKNVALAFLNVALQISKAFDSIFPPKTREQWVNITREFRNLTQALLLSDGVLDKIRRAFAGLFAAIDIGIKVVKLFGSIIGQIVKAFFPGLAGGALDIAANLGDFLVILNYVIEKTDIFGTILKYTGGFINFFAGGLKQIITIIVQVVYGLITGAITLQDLGAIIGAVVEEIGKFFEQLFGGSKIVQSIINLFKGTGEAAEETTDQVGGFTAFFTNAINKIKEFVNYVKTALYPVFKGIVDFLKNISLDQVIAIGVGVALIVIGRNLFKAVAPIATLLSGVAGVLDTFKNSITKVGNAISANLKADAILSIAKAFGLFILSLFAMTEVPWESIAKAGVVMLGFIVMIALLGKVTKNINMVAVGAGMGSLSIGLILIAASLKVLASIDNGALGTSIEAMAGLLLIIALYSKLVSKKGLSNAADGMIKLGFGILSLAGAMFVLGALPYTTLLSGMKVLASLLAIIALYTKLVSKKGLDNASKGMITLSLGIIALAAGIVVLSLIPWENLLKGTFVLGGLLLMIALFTKISSKKGLENASKGLIGLGVGLIAMAGAMYILGGLDFDALFKGGLAIGALMIAIMIFVRVTNGTDLSTSAASLMGFSVAVAILAGVAALLTLLDTGKLIAATAVVIGLLLAAGLFAKMTDLKSMLKTTGSMLLFALGLLAISYPIQQLAQIPWQNMLAVAGMILTVMVAIGTVGLVVSAFSKLNIGIVAAAKTMLAIGAALLLAGVIVAAFAALSTIPGIMEFMNGGAELLQLIGEAIGGFFGGMVGGFLGGVADSFPGIGKNLSDFSENLKPFIENTKGIDTGAMDGVKKVGELILLLGAADVLDALTGWLTGGSSIVDFGQDLVDFAPKIVEFSKILVEGGVDKDAVDAAASAGLVMAAFADSIPKHDGLAQVFTGDSTLAEFGQDLVDFAPKILEFSRILVEDGKIDQTAIDNAVAAGEIMVAFTDSLPKHGGLTQLFTGSNTLTDFGEDLVGFAPLLIQFSDILTAEGVSISQTAIEAARDAGEIMTAFAETLPPQAVLGGLFGGGTVTLSAFGRELAAFGPDFVTFLTELKDMPTTMPNIELVRSSATIMSDLAKTLPPRSVLGGLFGGGTTTLGYFAGELKAFGPDFVDFLIELQDMPELSEGMVGTAGRAASIMSELANGLPEEAAFGGLFGGGTMSLSDFAEELKDFAPSFVTFVNEFKNIEADSVQPGIDALTALATIFTTVGEEAMGNLGQSFENNTPDQIFKISGSLLKIVENVKGHYSSFWVAGQKVIQGLIKGMNDEAKKLLQTAETMTTEVLTTINETADVNSPSRETEWTGEMLAGGIVAGLESYFPKLKSVGEDTMDVITNSMQDTAGIHSFSDITTWIGQMLGGGVGAGLDSTLGGIIGQAKDWIGGVVGGMGIEGFDIEGLFGGSFDLEGLFGGDSSSFTTGIEDLIARISGDTGMGAEDVMAEMEESLASVGGAAGGAAIDMDALKESGMGAANQVQSAFEEFKAWLDEEKFYERITLEEEIKAWEDQQTRYIEGSETRKEIDRELYTLRKELIQQDYDREKKIIENRNFYNKLSQTEELQRIKELRAEYIDNAEIQAELAREEYTLQKKIYEDTKKYIEDIVAAQAEADQARIDAQIAYDDAIAAADETAKNDRLAAEKEYQTEVGRLQEDAAKARLDLEKAQADDIDQIRSESLQKATEAEQKYTDAVKTRADAIYGFFGLFDAVEEQEAITSEKLLENLAGQNAALEDWRFTMEGLEERGVSGALLEELTAMGYSSNAQLKALNAMTDEQLAEFVAMFDRKHELANFRALDELTGYREEVNNEISSIYEQADADILARMDQFNTELAGMQSELQTNLDAAKAKLEETTTQINETLEKSTTDAEKTLNSALIDISANLTQKTDELAASFKETMEETHTYSVNEYKQMTTDLVAELKNLGVKQDEQLALLEASMVTGASEAGEGLTESIEEKGTTPAAKVITDFVGQVPIFFKNFSSSMYEEGVKGAQGLATGLESGAKMVYMTAEGLVAEGLDGTTTKLDAHSPSRAMAKLGRYAALGFAQGMRDNLSDVNNAAGEMGTSSIDRLVAAIQNIANAGLMDIDNEYVITPVIDLSQVSLGLSALDSLFSSHRSYDLSAIPRANAARVKTNQNGSKNSEGQQINNYITLTGTTIREDADVDMLAERLYRKQQIAMRGRGSRTALAHL